MCNVIRNTILFRNKEKDLQTVLFQPINQLRVQQEESYNNN